MSVLVAMIIEESLTLVESQVKLFLLNVVPTGQAQLKPCTEGERRQRWLQLAFLQGFFI
jgi:hypothetical protein